MSYCRWSTGDFRCDLYIYADLRGGWTCHIGASRYALPDDAYPPESADPKDFKAWMARQQKVNELIRDAPTVRIELPYAGESRWFDDPYDLSVFLVELRELGYRFPFEIIDELRNEAV